MSIIKNILITGGAGFIGSNLARKLIEKDYSVTIYDNLNKQIHGGRKFSRYLKDNARVVIGDVTNKDNFYKALDDQDCVIHLAAETGTGQSMYEIQKYSLINDYGTSMLCDYMVNNRNNIKKIILASSRAVYGEGKYKCLHCGIVYPTSRMSSNMNNGNFGSICPVCNRTATLDVVPTDEQSKIQPTSIYGITKHVQEQIVMLVSQTISLDACILRFQNVYGPGQSLINPYTGILAIFSQLARQNEEIRIFEDGEESRDFVYIDDAVDAILKCVISSKHGQFVMNVGSGERVSVLNIAQLIKKYLNSTSSIKITGAFREGDIRHIVADITRAKKIIDYYPKWNLTDGLKKFVTWVENQKENLTIDSYHSSLSELSEKGLLQYVANAAK